MYLGVDTSNYTTSAALYDGENVMQVKKLLTVKKGERGLRQSDALFQHTVNLPELFKSLDYSGNLEGVAVSSRPRNLEGSYMPCFLAGINAAAAVSKFQNIPLYKTSHQVGHIIAALYSAGRLDLINRPFIAFHVSGGTTEALYISPDSSEIVKADVIGQSKDLKAGQAIDRAGVMMGFEFPCGKALDALSLKSDREFKVKPSMNGFDCSLSGVENKTKKMFADGEAKEDIAKFVLTYIGETICCMTDEIVNKFGNLPLIFAGGVISNTLIKLKIKDRYTAFFAKPEYSCDNAAGIAIYAYLKDKSI